MYIKKFALLLTALLIAFFGLSLNYEKGYKAPKNESDIEETEEKILASAEAKKKMAGVWLSYKEIDALISGKSEEMFTDAVRAVFEGCSSFGINAIFYHCRAFCDAYYESEIFPESGEDWVVCGYDPLEIFSSLSKEYDIDVHLWVNPLRVSYSSDIKSLPEESPAKELYRKNKSNLLICENGIYINPAGEESRKLIFSGIKELLEKYDCAGIHFDDYFYPEGDISGDEGLYNEYISRGGTMDKSDWRRENINALIGGVYSLVKSKNENLIFSVSPSADLEKCRNIFYADVEKWLIEDGFVDLIIPQIYFGFENENAPFKNLVNEWAELSHGNGKLALGLAAYKCGRIDENAGSGEREWLDNKNVLSRQYAAIENNSDWQGFVLFSYSYCFGENINQISKTEIKRLSDMVK